MSILLCLTGWERLWTFAKSVFPLSSLGQFFASAGQNIGDLRTLQRIFAESDERIGKETSIAVDNHFAEDSKASRIERLVNGGFFHRAPQKIASIREQWLTVGDSPTVLDLSEYFQDPNGDPLTYRVWADDYDEIKGEREGSKIKLTPIAAGEYDGKNYCNRTPQWLGNCADLLRLCKGSSPFCTESTAGWNEYNS